MDYNARRSRFLKKLQYFNDHYNEITREGEEIDILLDKRMNEQPIKRYCRSVSHIDIGKVKHITINYNNCFEPFFDLDDKAIFIFFEQLSEVELGTQFLGDFSEKYRGSKRANRNRSKQKKIAEVMDMLAEDDPHYETVINSLQRLSGALNNDHFTETQLFTHLLFIVAMLQSGPIEDVLSKVEKGELKNSDKISTVANGLIGDYFGSHIKFTKAFDIDRCTPHTYYYTDSKGIQLFHS